MGENTSIEWTATILPDGTSVPGHTFNPWWGCIEVSPGCQNCYAETWANRYGHDIWGPAKTTNRRLFGEKHWAEPLKWDKAAAKAGVRRRVFCASMADVFEDHPQVVEARQRLFEIIDRTVNLDWLILTKRPENVERLSPVGWWEEPGKWQNIWLGTSVEDQKRADERIPHLLKIPAVVRFLSVEPLLGPVDLWEGRYKLPGVGRGSAFNWGKGVDWVIVGGESGPDARPMHYDWVTRLRDDTIAAGAAFFFKQWGEYVPVHQAPHTTPIVGLRAYPMDDHYNEYVVKVGKKAAGHFLDGKVHHDFPVYESKLTAF